MCLLLLKTAPIPDVFTHVRLEGPSLNKHTTFLGAAFSITKNLSSSNTSQNLSCFNHVDLLSVQLLAFCRTFNNKIQIFVRRQELLSWTSFLCAENNNQLFVDWAHFLWVVLFLIWREGIQWNHEISHYYASIHPSIDKNPNSKSVVAAALERRRNQEPDTGHLIIRPGYLTLLQNA